MITGGTHGVVCTENYDDALSALAEHGLVCVPNVLSADEAAFARRTLLEVAEQDEAGGVPTRGMPFDPDRTNIRVFGLVNKHTVFADLVQHDRALPFVRHLLGKSYLLSNFSANITGPGGGRMYLHADQGYVPPPWPDFPLAANVMWLLDDFRDENGATHYVPGSHRLNTRPDPAKSYDTEAIEGSAGSIVIMDGRLWHQTGNNVTQNEHRAGMFAYYVKPWLRPQWNWYLDINPAVLEGASSELRMMLGYGENPTGSLQPLYLKDKK